MCMEAEAAAEAEVVRSTFLLLLLMSQTIPSVFAGLLVNGWLICAEADGSLLRFLMEVTEQMKQGSATSDLVMRANHASR